MIRFFVGEGGVGLREKRQVRAWLQEVLSHSGVRKADLNYIFCGDEYLYQLNLEYLGHDTYTDIITFPVSSGDIAKEKSMYGCLIYVRKKEFDEINASLLTVPQNHN